jgi:UPF0716 protein FxsA
MFCELFFLFTVVSLLELAVIIKVGSYLGAFTTILIIVATAVLGAYLAQMEGLQILFRLQAELRAGRMPSDILIEGLLVLAGGLLLLTPGFITDALGLLLIIPFSRRWFRERLKVYFRSKIEVHYFHSIFNRRI